MQCLQDLKAEIAALKAEGQRFSISGDVWGENGISLFAILVHWVSPDFKMQTRLASCNPFSDASHTSDNIMQRTKKRLASLGIGELNDDVDTVFENVFANV